MGRFRPFQVRLPSGGRYWTVVHAAHRPVVEADEWLLHVRRVPSVRQALADMHVDGSEITISAVAARAMVHRSFIHRHPDLHAAVLKAAADEAINPSPAAAAISHRSVLAENANLHELNRRLAQQISDLEHRQSELLGQQAFDRSGLDAPASTAAIHAELEAQRQAVLDLKKSAGGTRGGTRRGPRGQPAADEPAQPIQLMSQRGGISSHGQPRQDEQPGRGSASF